MGEFAQDLRLAMRRLTKARGFTLACLAVLALGMGVNLALFTLADGIFLRPLPYGDPSRLVTVGKLAQESGAVFSTGMMSADAIYLQQHAGFAYDYAQLYDATNVHLQEGDGGYAEMRSSTANLFDVLGVRPQLGRGFRAEENEPGKNQVVALSDAIWRRNFHADRNVIGREIAINGKTYAIIGVMPRGFTYPFAQGSRDQMQMWTPEPITPAQRVGDDKTKPLAGDVILRLPQGVTREQAQASLGRAQADYAATHENEEARLLVEGYQESMNKTARKPLLLLTAVMAAIWLLACLNVAGLMLARALGRRRELAVCSALGAGRWRLVRQMLTESLLLSLMSSALAAGLAWATLRLLRHRLEASRLPMTSTIAMGGRTMLAMLVLALLTTLLVGLYPAWRAARADAQKDLRGGGGTPSRAQHRLRGVLIIGQLAITLMLLMSAGLFLRTVSALRTTPLGFHEMNVLTGGVILSRSPMRMPGDASDASPDVVQTVYRPLLERLRAMPGVRSASLSSVLPMNSNFTVMVSLGLDGKHGSFKEQPHANGRIASWGFAETLGAPMASGRFFTASDTASSPSVVVVNQAFADAYLRGANPLEHELNIGKDKTARIVGVIADMKQRRVDKQSEPEVYFCLDQVSKGSMMYGIATAFTQVAVRSEQPAGGLRAQMEKALDAVDPNAVVVNVRTMREAVEDSFGDQLLISQLLTGFAALALLISGIGLYALLSYAVEARRREIGVRLALGARRDEVSAMILRQALWLLGAGLAIGAAASWFAARLASSYLYGVKPHDFITYALVMLALLTAGLAASLLPARRAASVDPMQALRSE